MIRYFKVFILLLSLQMFAQQTGEIAYAVKVKVNDSIASQSIPWENSVQHLADSVGFKLLFTDKVAYFQILKDKPYEQMISVFQKNHPRIKKSTYQPASYFKYQGAVWQMGDANYRFIPKKMFVDDCIRKDPIQMDWELTDESQEILGYTCKKAVMKTSFFHKDEMKNYKIEVVAWFTDEIPYAYGPNVYNGLPGLVLKYEDIFFDYIAQKVDFKEVIIPKLPENYPIYTLEKYRELWEKEMNNF